MTKLTLTNPPVRPALDANGEAMAWGGRPVFHLMGPLILTVELGDLDNGGSFMELVVPKGFLTDFASLPWFCWWLRVKDSRPAIVHDFLYSKKGGCSRFLADVLFREAMKAAGAPLWKRLIIYYGLRVGGWWAWRTR